MRHESVTTRQLGNFLEVTVLIPWEDVHGQNKWLQMFQEQEDSAKQRLQIGLDYWAVIEKNVIDEWTRSESISKAAKAGPCKYYTARIIIDKHRKSSREGKRNDLKAKALLLSKQGMPYYLIAEQLGKCPETIRLWLKNERQ